MISLEECIDGSYLYELGHRPEMILSVSHDHPLVARSWVLKK